MLKEDFNKWPVISVANNIFISLRMYVFSLGYLENGSSWFVELPDGGTKESNILLMGLNKQTFFADDKQLPALDNSNVE